MQKIFYRKENLQIMGMSDGENSLDFPYVETSEFFHSTENLEIKIVDNVAVLSIVEN